MEKCEALELVESISAYVIKNFCKSIDEFAQYSTSNTLPLQITGHRLLNISPLVGQTLLNDPVVFFKLLESVSDSIRSSYMSTLKQTSILAAKNVRILISDFPMLEGLHKRTTPTVDDIGKFLIIEGKIIGTSKVKQMFYRRKFYCEACGFRFDIDVDIIDLSNQNNDPTSCPSSMDCMSDQFIHVEDMCTDYQELILQEIEESVNGRGMMNSITTFIQDDLVDSYKPGDHVIVYGTVLVRFKKLVPNCLIDSQIFIKANNVVLMQKFDEKQDDILYDDFSKFWDFHVKNSSCDRARNEIINSLCPQAKLSVLMGIIGGTTISNSGSGIKQRGESHILLVGDPGCGKSQLLKQACCVMPKSILTSGAGTTSAGLTASVTKEVGLSHWSLEAGALPSVNNGILCIDEFNSLRKADKTSIHEAMEQQTISVAKAGIICHLKTNVSIIAACNLQPTHSDNLCDVTGIPSPLLSRFDLIVYMKDYFDPELDALIADFVLNNRDDKIINLSLYDFPWSLKTLKSYISVVKGLKPELQEDSSSILKKYYQHCRSSTSRDSSRTTVRLLESLTRLATAHAKLMFHKNVTVEDALTAVELVDSSISVENLKLSANKLKDPMNEELGVSNSNFDQLLKLLKVEPKITQIAPSQQITNTTKTDQDIMKLLIQEDQTNEKIIHSTAKPASSAQESLFCMDFDENSFDDSLILSSFKTKKLSPDKPNFYDNLKQFKK